MKPVEATWEGRRAPRGGYLEPFVLLEPPAHNPGCPPWTCMRLDPALTPLKLLLLTVLDLCVFFMPDPRLLDPVSLFLNGRTFRCSCCRIR